MEKKTCFRCGAECEGANYAPEVSDEVAWLPLIAEHHPRCWWVVSRGGQSPLTEAETLATKGHPPRTFPKPLLILRSPWPSGRAQQY